MNIALYIRLSSADEDTGFGKTESESIINQRKYLNHYLNGHETLSLGRRNEFVDDGFSGTNGNRPALSNMMEAVRRRELDVICVKDFSRFFRDYIEAGNFLECVFPFLGVRFISVNDNYDSDKFKGTTGGMEMVMRNIIYAAYSKDLSLKVRTGKVQMMKQGKYIGSHPPYGYQKNPQDKNQLIIDPNSTKVVRLIFDLALEGKVTREIAVVLNTEQIPTLGQYFKSRYPNSKKYSSMWSEISWNSTRVHGILTNQLYTGDLICHRKRKVDVFSNKTVRQNPIVVEGTHEGIVTKEEFKQAQQVIKGGLKKPERTYAQFPLKGLVRCGNCKYMMERSKRGNHKYVYTCNYASNGSNYDCSKDLMVDEVELESLVFQSIRHLISLAKMEGMSPIQSTFQETTAKLDTLARQIDGCKTFKLRLYERYTCEEVSRELYLKEKAELEIKITQLERAKEVFEQARQCREDVSEQNELVQLCNTFAKTLKLSYEMAQAFVDDIYIHDNESIEIKLKFQDLFELK